MRKHPIATICCPTRFKKLIEIHSITLTLDGYIVFTPTCLGRDMKNIIDNDSNIKNTLVEIFKEKIFMSDVIYVLRVNGYLGKDTLNDIKYAEELGKDIIYIDLEN